MVIKGERSIKNSKQKLTNLKLSVVIPPKFIWEVVGSSKPINSLSDWLGDDKGMESKLGISDSELSILSSPSTKTWGRGLVAIKAFESRSFAGVVTIVGRFSWGKKVCLWYVYILVHKSYHFKIAMYLLLTSTFRNSINGSSWL